MSARSGHPLGLPESAAAAGAAAHTRFRLSGWDWLLRELSPSTVNLLTNHVHPSGTGGGRWTVVDAAGWHPDPRYANRLQLL